MVSQQQPFPRPLSDTDHLLHQILAEIRELRLEVEDLRGLRPYSATEQEAKLIAAISEIARGLVFSSREVIEHARLPAAETLKAALADARLTSARLLGRWLKRMESRDFGDLRVFRRGDDRDGAVWVIAPAKLAETHTARGRATKLAA